jgi:TatD DNase family protein
MPASVFVDAHCHLDEVGDPMRAVVSARREGGVLVAMTPTPDHFRRAQDRYSGLATVRVALGLHPLYAGTARRREVEAFAAALRNAKYVGEVGLDRSREGLATWDRQLEVFEQLLGMTGGRTKLWSVHTRRAEGIAIPLLIQARVPAVLHWYSGSLANLEEAVDGGLYFSVNASMLASTLGRRIVRRMPRERVLTETDAPYSRAGHSDPITAVSRVVRDLAEMWSVSADAAKDMVFGNMTALAALAWDPAYRQDDSAQT